MVKCREKMSSKNKRKKINKHESHWDVPYMVAQLKFKTKIKSYGDRRWNNFSMHIIIFNKKRYIIVVNEKLNNESKDFLRY